MWWWLLGSENARGKPKGHERVKSGKLYHQSYKNDWKINANRVLVSTQISLFWDTGGNRVLVSTQVSQFWDTGAVSGRLRGWKWQQLCRKARPSRQSASTSIPSLSPPSPRVPSDAAVLTLAGKGVGGCKIFAPHIDYPRRAIEHVRRHRAQD